MRIGFDLRSFLKAETGVGVYLKNLLHSLAEIDKANTYYLLSASLKVRFPKAKLPEFAKSRFRDLILPSQLLDRRWSRGRGPRFDAFFQRQMDLTHSPTPLILPTAGKALATVHDLFYVDHPEKTDKDTRAHFVRQTGASLDRADGIIAASHYTREDMLAKFPIDASKVRVIHHGTHKRFKVPLSTAFKRVLQDKYQLPEEFLLFVGAVEPRKNLPCLVDALKILEDRLGRIPLLIIGRKGSDYHNLQARIKRNGLESSVRVLDYLPDEDVQGIYGLSTLFVFPSLCEGFGFPLLEAMASGVPIAASRAAALPEIAGDAALYFDPGSPEAIADALQRGLEETETRRRLVERGRLRIQEFDWARSARATLDFYQALAGGN